jgi:hypothetical protein
MSTPADRKRWSELASVGLAVIAVAFLFFEVIQSQLPGYLQAAIGRPGGPAAWAVAAALGLSLLCSGIGVISISGIRLLLALRKADASLVHAAAKDHLCSVVIVVVGFVMSVAALYVLSQVKA